MPPYLQGQFDGFCGVYSAINGLRLLFAHARPLTYPECERLYRRGVELIERRGRLDAAASWGVGVTVWRKVVADLCARAADLTRMKVKAVRPLKDEHGADRRGVLLAIEQAVTEGWPVLVLLRGAYRHYSVVRGTTPTRLLLYDSYGYAWIEKASCGTGHSQRRHQLPVTAITVLKLR